MCNAGKHLHTFALDVGLGVPRLLQPPENEGVCSCCKYIFWALSDLSNMCRCGRRCPAARVGRSVRLSTAHRGAAPGSTHAACARLLYPGGVARGETSNSRGGRGRGCQCPSLFCAGTALLCSGGKLGAHPQQVVWWQWPYGCLVSLFPPWVVYMATCQLS